MVIKWKEATSAFQRNGGLKCHGLDIWHSDSFKTVMLSAITSRGERATGHISIPDNKVVDVIQALVPKGQKACTFVEVSDLVPKSWTPWFWGLISEGAPFDWGNNNRSLVTASDFARHCEARLLDCKETSQSAKTKFLKQLWDLGETYIDLEN